MKNNILIKISSIVLTIILMISICPIGLFGIIADAASTEFSVDGIMASINEVPTYTGNAIEINPTVTLYGENLTEGVDYTLSFSNNINATSHAKITITGINDYWGYSEVIYFPIQRANISNADIIVQDVTYTSCNLEPKVTVSFNGKQLIQETDFVVQYIDNYYVGFGTARIIGVGNYCGYSDVQFEITKPVATTTHPNGNNLVYRDGKYYEAEPMYIPAGTTIKGTVSSYYGTCEIVFCSLSGEIKTVYTQDLTLEYPYNYYSTDFTYSYTCKEAGWYALHLNYSWRSPTGYQTAEAGSTYKIYEIWCDVPPDPEMVVAGIPVEYGLRETYLHIESEDTLFAVCDPVWNSNDTTIATVNNGIVKFKKAGKAVVSAKVGECTAIWEIDNEALDISKNTTIFWDEEKNKYNVFWKNEMLIENIDYTLNITKKAGIDVVKITGINLFSGDKLSLFYENSNCLYVCEHIYDNDDDLICNMCESTRERPYTPGDIDGVKGITDADAEYMLMYTFFPEDYPINQDCDFNGDGKVNDADAEHLLMYTFFPEDYPLH